ncbi:S-adenosyl-L-methionine-dependent methyltransferase [Lasiosphaeris hirsuta]|uniref:S-adenosyl-L-methionine-dependent methyltransferase n=1 Tax=Lasiosphaeris hirsuta TaxID=260670 RepID=A0AA40BC49_9PEZI|nr:S-adenosyl-L-methionine-dependent methyltransferase [Lasiosphaeris hirsuta]
MDSHQAGTHSERGHPPPVPRVNTQVYQENGRFYGTFKKGKYMFPVDETELDRLDIFHKFFTLLRRDAFFNVALHNQESPKILDLGCGTGLWGIDVAERFPKGKLLGLDLNLIQPEYIPPNILFFQRDIELPWQDMDPGSWDLIHMRTLNGSIANWPKLYQEIHRHLKPYYGYIEQVEIDWTPRTDDGSLPPNSFLMQWAEELMDAMDGFDRSIRVDSNLTKQRMMDAGFVDLNEETIKFALNGWPNDARGREIGRWFNLGFTQGMQALTMAPLSRGHGKTHTEIMALIEKALVEVRSLKVHAYFTV